MRKKVIVEIDDNYNIYDVNGSMIVTALASNDFEEPPEPSTPVDVAQLIGLGVTPDDLIKLKASGLIS